LGEKKVFVKKGEGGKMRGGGKGGGECMGNYTLVGLGTSWLKYKPQ